MPHPANLSSLRTRLSSDRWPGPLRGAWKSAPATVVRRSTLRVGTQALTTVYESYKVHPALWRWTARHYHPAMENLARQHAWMTCQLAAIDVPAYREHLRENDWGFSWFDLASYPQTSKDSYVRRYAEKDRCRNGSLDRVGTIVDESSGSSGTPYNWVRGRRELDTVHRNVAGLTTQVFPHKNLFVINAYSMGAWATGTHTGIAMAKIAMVKNTGPDLEKIVDTLAHFGPGYDYLITAYPPFLKDLRDRLDEVGFDWSAHRLFGLVGGEGMTEALRDYCEERFEHVRSGYGASDLTIGIGAESALTVWLREQLYADIDLKDTLLGHDESRIPMIFQYNPLETYLETTDDGELLCTLNSTAVLSPKLRYNIGDEARLMSMPTLRALVKAEHPHTLDAFDAAQRTDGMRLPLLMLFGRSDSTVSFMGANIYPQDVEYGLYQDNPDAHKIAGFMLTLEESAELDRRPVVNLQLREGVELDEDQREELSNTCRAGIVDHLLKVSRDFQQSVDEDPSTLQIATPVYDFGQGPFAATVGRIKKVYLQEGS